MINKNYLCLIRGLYEATSELLEGYEDFNLDDKKQVVLLLDNIERVNIVLKEDLKKEIAESSEISEKPKGGING